MFATSILAPIASGLLTTINLSGDIAKPAALMGFLGVAIGLGVQAPFLAVQAVLPPKDVSIGGAVVGFGGNIGSALWIVVSVTLFTDRLTAEIHHYSPTTNATMVEDIGLSNIRTQIGSGKLAEILSGYNAAVVETLYVPVALAALTIFGSIAMERRSLKKKQN